MDSPTDVAPAPGPQTPPPGPRQLRRRPDDGHIAGVCAGVAEYFNVDPVIVRIAAVVLLLSGPGAFAYVLAWIFVPAADGRVDYGAAQAPIDRKDRATQVFGVALIVLAVSVFWGDWWSPARHWLLPLGLMALGAWLLLRRDADDVDAVVSPPPAGPPSTPTAPPAAWAWGAGTSDVTATAPAKGDAEGDRDSASEAAIDPTIASDPDPLVDANIPVDATPEGDGSGATGGDEPPTSPWDAAPRPVPWVPPARSRRRVLGPIVFGTLLVWSGVAVLAGVTLETGLAGGLLIIGIGFVLGAFVGGVRLLILPALLVAAALAVTAVIDIPLRGPIGEQHWAPTIPEQLYREFEVSLGEGTLDLRGVDVPAGESIGVEASAGVGNLVVLVPPGMAVEAHTEVGAGESDVFGVKQNGVNVTTDQSADGDGTSGTVVLDVQVGVGHVEVRHDPLDFSTPVDTTLE